jgi:hypothetical protein
MDNRKFVRVCYRSPGPLFAGDREPAAPGTPAEHLTAGVRLRDILTALSLLAVVAAFTALLLTSTTDPAAVTAPPSTEWYP